MSTRDAEQFPSGTEGLSSAAPPQIVELADGERFELRIAPVAKQLGDDTVRMLAYNGSVPGPVLKVREGSRIGRRLRAAATAADAPRSAPYMNERRRSLRLSSPSTRQSYGARLHAR